MRRLALLALSLTLAAGCSVQPAHKADTLPQAVKQATPSLSDLIIVAADKEPVALVFVWSDGHDEVISVDDCGASAECMAAVHQLMTDKKSHVLELSSDTGASI